MALNLKLKTKSRCSTCVTVRILPYLLTEKYLTCVYLVFILASELWWLV